MTPYTPHNLVNLRRGENASVRNITAERHRRLRLSLILIFYFNFNKQVVILRGSPAAINFFVQCKFSKCGQNNRKAKRNLLHLRERPGIQKKNRGKFALYVRKLQFILRFVYLMGCLWVGFNGGGVSLVLLYLRA